MAINKTINKSTKTHGAMRNCMEYALRERKINSSLVYVRETEEELNRERRKSAWDKFREKHHLRLPKRKYRSCYYTRKSFGDWFAEKMLFPLGCVIFAVVVFAVLIHFDLLWYMW